MNPFRKLKALYSLAQLVRDPNRLGDVFEMADALAEPKRLAAVVAQLADHDPALGVAMDENHRFRIDLEALRRLPEGTLGRTFADNMVKAGLDPSALPNLVSTDRGSFFRAHLYETHDIWHTVTGFDTDRFGEIGLQGFYLAQIGDGLSPLLLAVGFLRVALYEQGEGRRMMDGVERGYRMGKSAKPFFGVHWDEMWSLPLAEVRRRLGVEVEADAAPSSIAIAA